MTHCVAEVIRQVLPHEIQFWARQRQPNEVGQQPSPVPRSSRRVVVEPEIRAAPNRASLAEYLLRVGEAVRKAEVGAPASSPARTTSLRVPSAARVPEAVRRPMPDPVTTFAVPRAAPVRVLPAPAAGALGLPMPVPALQAKKLYQEVEQEPVFRIALVLAPDRPHELRHAIRLMRHTTHGLASQAHEYLVPEPLWRSPDVPARFNAALAQHYPLGRAAPRDERRARCAARVRVVESADTVPEHCDLMLIGALDPRLEDHQALLRLLAYTAHRDIARMLLSESALSHAGGKAIVWGAAHRRHDAWELRGEAALTQTIAHQDAARVLVAKARAPDLDALIVHASPPRVPGVAEHLYGETLYDAQSARFGAPYDRSRDALLALLTSGSSPGRHAFEPPRALPDRLRGLQVDPGRPDECAGRAPPTGATPRTTRERHWVLRRRRETIVAAS